MGGYRMKPETEFRIKFGKALKKLEEDGAIIYFTIQQQTQRGDPDYFICGPRGQFIAVELKSEEGVPSALQTYKLDRISHLGGISFIVSPINWDNAIQEIRKICRKVRR
jgi:hypothetical protein